jgi:hypothetical protein
MLIIEILSLLIIPDTRRLADWNRLVHQDVFIKNKVTSMRVPPVCRQAGFNCISRIGLYIFNIKGGKEGGLRICILSGNKEE